MPVTNHIQPPKRAIKILIRWVTEIPVDQVAVISSWLEAMR
jgi:hypothetical protein